MIPLRDVIPSRTTPFVTLAVILVNVTVFVARSFGLVSGAPAWPPVLTSLFLHADWLHAGTNMGYLWIFGENVEDRLGHGRFLLFYLLCGTGAALAQAAAGPLFAAPAIGASGAVAGLLGAYFVLFPHSRVLMLMPAVAFVELVEVPAIYFLVLWVFLQLAMDVGATGGPDAAMFWSQAAGFAAGVGLVFALRRPERLRIEWVE